MATDKLADLTDLALQFKENFEAVNMQSLRKLFARQARVNVLGRFLEVDDFISQLGDFLAKVDQPTLDLLRVEESSVEENTAFSAYITEVSMIDRRTWQEHTIPGRLSFDVRMQKERRWEIVGLTFARLPEKEPIRDDWGREENERVPRTPPPPPMPLGIRGLFSFWY